MRSAARDNPIGSSAVGQHRTSRVSGLEFIRITSYFLMRNCEPNRANEVMESRPKVLGRRGEAEVGGDPRAECGGHNVELGLG
jgi:hypothetical protein